MSIANYPANIYIDGPDATGKSTIAKLFTDTYDGWKSIHLDASTPNDYNFHHDCIERSKLLVYDRFMVSEMIYSTIYKRSCKLNFDEFMRLWNDIMLSGSMYIILYTSDMSILRERLIERGEFAYLEEIEQQNNLFKFWANLLSVFNYPNFHMFDIADPDYNKNLNIALSDFAAWTELHSINKVEGDYVIE